MDQGRLSAKEVEVLALIAQGHDAKSAARELALSTHTIYERLRRAREKLGTTNSREAARLFFANERASEVDRLGTCGLVEDCAASIALGLGPNNRFAEQESSFTAMAPAYEASSLQLDLASYLPLRRKGEQQFSAMPAERMRLIGDLSSRLAMAFVSICLGALILSRLFGD